jgi:hypothetical protein
VFFENRVLRRIFGPRRDEFHNLCSSPNVIRQIKTKRMRWLGNVAHMGEDGKMFKVLVGKPKGKRPL